MNKKLAKAVAASFMAATMLTTTVATVVPMSVSAGQVLGENDFTHKALPWHTCETNPAKQLFDIDHSEGDGGSFHVTILNNVGGDGDRWDLQTRHRNLNFTANHKYTVTWSAKASRQGVKVYTKIGNIKGDEEYWVGNPNGGGQGPHMGGDWGNAVPVELSTSWQTYTSTFVPTQDLEGVEWAFHYAKGGSITNSGENSKNGDEIWFDNMSIVDESGSDNDWDPTNDFGAVRRDNAPTKNEYIPYITVNQVGYYSNLEKVATLGDNKGDIMFGASSINLADSPYEFQLIDVSTNTAVYTGQTKPDGLDKDSGDTVHQIDFTEYETPGRYYLKVGDWRSFEFNIGDNIYTDESHNMLTNAMNYFYQNRSGIDIKSQYITSGDKTTLAHEGGHKIDEAAVQTEWIQSYDSMGTPDDAQDDIAPYTSSKITATGGWYDAGDHGKYVVNGGISVWTLQNMYERAVVQGNGDKFKDGSGAVVIPEAGNSVPDVLDECAVELDWMMDMVVKSDEPTWGKYAGLVYHKLHDHKWTGLATRPYDYEDEWHTARIVKPPTYAATLNFVACAAQAARLWEPYDSAKAKKYLDAAKTSYAAYKTHFKEYTDAEKNNKQSLYAPLDQAIGGGAYGDNNVKDDAYWAACELYASTGDKTYYDDLASYSGAFEVVSYLEGGENKGSFGSFNWGNTASAGSLSLYLNKDNSKLTNLSDANKSKIISTMTKAADLYVAKSDEQGYGIPYEGTTYTDPVNLPADLEINGFEWGSNSFVINNAIIMAYVYDETQDIKYMNGVATSLDYLFGRNPLSVSYITGYGTYKISRPHHRYWSNELDKTLPMAPDGVMSGGPNAGLQDPYVRALGFVPGNADNSSERCYVDSIEAWSTNEVTINWNSPFAWIVSFMQDEAKDAVPSALKVTPSNVTVKVGETEKLEVTVDGKPASGATFSSSDESTAKVSSDGTVTGVKEGSATITVTVNGETKTVKVTVTNESTTESTEATGTTGTTGTTVPSYTGTEELMYGDTNVDGEVSLADAILLAKHLLSPDIYSLGDGTPETVAKGTEQADVKYDRAVNESDLEKLNEYNIQNVTKDQLGPQ